MPVASGPRISSRSAVIVGVSGVVAAAMLVLFVLWLTDTGQAEFQAGDSDFRNIDAESMAEEIAERGPVTWSNPGDQARPIWLQHLGDDPEVGWHAFDARVPSAPGCLAQWDGDRERFVSDCDDAVTFPADGTGLDQFPVEVADGEVIIDINPERSDPGAG